MSSNKKALIGYTGFVGGNLNNQFEFTDKFNSQNITEIEEQCFDLIVCAGVRAEKWKANQDPQADWDSIQDLISRLEKVEADKFILISTIDVYPKPIDVDEGTPIDPESNHAYGKHRYQLEVFVKGKFNSPTIVRLPGLFGNGLKKNLIFDMIHHNNIQGFHQDSTFQFYNLDHIWKDIQVSLDNNLELINFATEPTSVREVFKAALDTDFENDPGKPPISYDIHTTRAHLYGKSGDYLYDKDQILAEIQAFVKKEIQ
jgi:nucleoside-diphosphate-sugar epimerase